MAFCGNCGSPIADDAKFCENCGAPNMQAMSSVQSQAESAPQYSFTAPDPEPQQPFGGQQAEQPFGGQQTEQSFGGQQEQQPFGGQQAQYSYGGQQAQYSYGGQQQTGSPSYGSGASYGQDNTSYAVPQTGGPTPMMGFMDAIRTCFSKYATFEGRARRSEYWFYSLFIFLVQFALAIIGFILGIDTSSGTNILNNIFSLAILVPSLAVFWRRMHDIGKSGVWFFLALVPCVGSIVLLVFECMDSVPGENQYGDSPKYPSI